MESLEHEAELLRRFGHDVDVLDAARIRAEVNSPTYLGGLWVRSGAALVHPGKLADGLCVARRSRGGVRIFEHDGRGSVWPAQAIGYGVKDSGGVHGARRRCCSRRARIRRCCVRSAATSRPSTTTR